MKPPHLCFNLCIAAAVGVSPVSADASVDFNRDIRPLLSRHCYACHGPDTGAQVEELRLDTAEGAAADSGGRRIVEPARQDDSKLIARIESSDPDIVMSPQPPRVWRSTCNILKWETTSGPDRCRRALYTYWKYTSPYPVMTTFDAGTAEVCQNHRVRTKAPLPALMTLNDPVFLRLRAHWYSACQIHTRS